jgi:hypothetical protein
MMFLPKTGLQSLSGSRIVGQLDFFALVLVCPVVLALLVDRRYDFEGSNSHLCSDPAVAHKLAQRGDQFRIGIKAS